MEFQRKVYRIPIGPHSPTEGDHAVTLNAVGDGVNVRYRILYPGGAPYPSALYYGGFVEGDRLDLVLGPVGHAEFIGLADHMAEFDHVR